MFFVRIIRFNITRKSEPLCVALILTNRCNFDCFYCVGGYRGRKNDDFSIQEVVKIVDDLYDLGCRYLIIHGGEALLRKDLPDILRHIRAKGIYIGLVTNGSLLTSKMELLTLVDSLCISLDGAEEGNDRNRGKGSYRLAINAIAAVRKAGYPLRVSATLTRHTRKDVLYLAELARTMDFALQFSILYKPLDRQDEAAMNDEETKAVLQEILVLKRRGYPIFTSRENLEYALRWPFSYSKGYALDGELPAAFHPVRCLHGKLKFIIDADGAVYPCYSLIDAFPKPNIKSGGVKLAVDEVVKNNNCVACPHLSDNDYNLLFNLSPRQVWEQIRFNMREIISKKRGSA